MRLIVPALLILALGACGSSKPADTAQTAPPPKPQPTVLDPQLKALEKAKAVQDVVDKNAKKQDDQLKDAGG
jgi:hypothetical protein